jgi:hypothetical protein
MDFNGLTPWWAKQSRYNMSKMKNVVELLNRKAVICTVNARLF